MSTVYQTAVAAIKAEAAVQREIDHKSLQRQFAEAKNIVASGATSYQATFATIRGESANQRQVDMNATERAIAESNN